jgi:hypothetical protein
LAALMAPYYPTRNCCTCTGTCWCYFAVGMTTTTATSGYFYLRRRNDDEWLAFDVSDVSTPEARPSLKEIALWLARERLTMAPPRELRARRPVVALNTGMQLRRMRASTGLARGRA